jgi:photosystem II stability/assembly factor-like uncharacterized protein
MNLIRRQYLNATLAAALLLVTSTSLLAHFGPRTPFGGRVTCGTTFNGIVYFGTEQGGVFETTNNQIAVWRPRPVGLHTGSIAALAHSGSYLFAGTADGGVYIFNGFVGNDRYWNRINNGLGNLEIRSLVTVDSITVLAGTNGGGLYKTIDKGQNWYAINSPQLNGTVVSAMSNAGSRLVLTTLGGGVFASDDAGETWTDLNDGNTFNVGGTLALSYNSTTDELIVLNENGLFLAGNASTTGSAVYVPASSGLSSIAAVRGISNNGTNWYLATDAGVYTSGSGTISWSTANTGLGSLNTTAVVALPATAVVAVWKEGIFKTETTAVNWALTNNGFANPITHSMTAKGDGIVVTANEDGVFVSEALGTAASYVRANNGLTDSLNVNDLIFAGDILLAATTNNGVFSSSNLGVSWNAINTGATELNIHKLFFGNDRLYAISANGLLFSTDLGSVSWAAAQTGLPSGTVATSLAFQGNKILLGTLGNGTFIRENNAANWTAFNTGLGNLNVTSVSASGGKFFAGTDGSGVYSTNTDAANWTATAQTSIPHTVMIGLNGDAIQAMDSYAGYVYASYKGGLLATSDGGATWEEGGNQFNLPSFTDVRKIGFVSTRVYVTTQNNGPYSNSLSELPTLTNFLTLSDELFNVPGTTNSNYVSVTGNVPWTLTSNSSWLSTSTATGIRNGGFRIDAEANSGGQRTGTITVSSDSLSQTFTVTVIQEGTTGIAENGTQAFRLFPNPNDGNFTVDLSGVDSPVRRISVLDVTGKVVMAQEINSAAAGLLNLSVPCSTGTYIFVVDTEHGRLFERVMID